MQKAVENQTENKMGRDPVLKLIISMSLPAMFSMLVQALYNIVDSYFVSQVSENALTAVSLAFPIQMLMVSVAVGTSIGINSFISRKLGERRQELADSAAAHGILLAVFSWFIFALVGIFGSRFFFQSFTDIAEIVEMGTQYIGICCICSFGVFVEVNLEKTLQATGNMIYPMLFQLVGAVTNIILDPIFIFGWLGLPAMGVSGAAIATVLGQIVSMLFAIYIVKAKDHDITIRFKGFKFDWGIVKSIYAVGFPSIIMQSIGSVMNVAMNAILISFTETAVAVFGVYYKLQSFIFMPVFGLTHGVMPIMGYNFGARNKARLMSALKIGGIIALIIMTVGTVIFWAVPDLLLSIFNASDHMLKIGVPALRLISTCFIPAALGIIFSTLFQAVGKGTYSLIISVLRQLVILVPCAYLLAQTLQVENVWFAFPIAETFSLLASVLLFVRLYRKTIKPLSTAPE